VAAAEVRALRGAFRQWRSSTELCGAARAARAFYWVAACVAGSHPSWTPATRRLSPADLGLLRAAPLSPKCPLPLKPRRSRKTGRQSRRSC